MNAANPDPPPDVFPGIQAERVQTLNDRSDRDDGRYVIYWMQQAQRAEHNHALDYAIRRANELAQPLLVVFGLTDDYPEANLRHYTFLVQGLADVAAALERRHIPFLVRRCAPEEAALAYAADASLLVCDRGYLREQRAWRKRVAADAPCPVVQVETDVVVPVELATDKRETAARTLRPRLTRHLDRFLVPLRPTPLRHHGRPVADQGEDVSSPDALLDRMELDRSVGPVPLFTGGTAAGKKVLRQFLDARFAQYAEHRNQPQTDDVSHMSKYLHFGQLSPVYIALQVREHGSGENADSFLEELIVRRELPMNYVSHVADYDKYTALPEWARITLAEHESDEREHVYTRGQLEGAQTHDPYWNAAMREMKLSGYMHNHMRMYWGKKILEWSRTPQRGFATTLYLNNKYFLDGRDANSYANVAWLYGTHDRGWTERPVFGKVRSMTAGGLERKTDPQAYVAKIDQLAADLPDS